MKFLEPGLPVRIKICGITAQDDAAMAIDAGADALGFNFFRGSRRFIPLEGNRSWIASLAGKAFRVAVVVNATVEELTALRSRAASKRSSFTALKLLSSAQPSDFLSGFAQCVCKASTRSRKLSNSRPRTCCWTPGPMVPTAAPGATLIGLRLRALSSHNPLED